MRGKESRTRISVAVLSALLLWWCGTPSAASILNSLTPQLLDELQAMEPKLRLTYLKTQGVHFEKLVIEFQEATNSFQLAPKERERQAGTNEQLRLGIRLIRLIDLKETTPSLIQLASSSGVPKTMVYEVLVTLSELKTADDFMLSLVNSADSDSAGLAVLAIGVRPEASISERIVKLKDSGIQKPQVAAALQLIKMYHHDVELYSSLVNLPEKISFVEERLRRVFNPLNGVMQTSDPFSGGHPLSRWALEEWGRLARRHTLEVGGYISAVQVYEEPEINDMYRRFLSIHAGLAAE